MWCWKVSGLKKDLLQEGHINPTPKCTLHTCVQMVVHEVDGPSLQPSTWHWYTHLTIPAEYKGVAYLWRWPPLKLEGQLERQTSLPGSQDQRHQVLWTPGGMDGGLWWMGCGRLSCEEVGLGIWRNVTLLPSEAHRNPPPLNLPLPLPSFPVPQSPSIAPPPPVCGPPPSGNQPFLVDPSPER